MRSLLFVSCLTSKLIEKVYDIPVRTIRYTDPINHVVATQLPARVPLKTIASNNSCNPALCTSLHRSEESEESESFGGR